MKPRRNLPLLVLLLAIAPVVRGAADSPLPALLSQTGLYADIDSRRPSADVIAFSPQYPLWSDGASKQRWIRLPPGKAVDARNPDAWEFPVGTRLWKEFAGDRAIETRMIDRLADGSWRYLSYAWRADGRDAELVSPRGQVVDGGHGPYRIPSQADCRVCHEGAAVPVLGFSALQLSPDRDALAPNAEASARPSADLAELVGAGHLLGLPDDLLQHAPRIQAASATERAALGYLHGNCGHCHNSASEAGVPTGLLLSQQIANPGQNAAVRASLRKPSARYRPGGADDVPRARMVVHRMRSRDPRVQMPPLGTEHIDENALALIERWLAEQDFPRQGGTP